MKPFKVPKKSLTGLEPDIIGRLVGLSADVALVIDPKGIVRDLATESDELLARAANDWVGRPWIETVTIESRPKIEELLREAKTAKPRWRQVNHPIGSGADLPIRYTAVELSPHGRLMAIGRDLRAMASLQQQIATAQRRMELEFLDLRQSHTRYRALFYSTLEAVLIVDMASMRIVEANPSAAQLLAKSQRKLAGRPFIELFTAAGEGEVQSALDELRSQSHSRERLTNVHGLTGPCQLTMSVVRQDNGAVFLIARMATASGELTRTNARSGGANLDQLVAAMPDAFVVTDAQGIIQSANAAFLALAQLATVEQARGSPLTKWLGRTDADLGVMLSSLRQHGTLRRFNSLAHGEFGSSEPVEISAVSALASDPPTVGFVIRASGSNERATNPLRRDNVLPRSTEEMTALVGQVPLKDLVRETTDIIERMCIEAALQLTEDNRASAAEMLGLSRQALYTKLRRFGIDSPSDTAV